MITDLLTAGELPVTDCDVCIIGSGAAGLAIATDLDRSRLNVVVLESGGSDYEAETQGLYDTEVVGVPYAGAEQGRFRVAGGSTTRWGGQALPLTPLDFDRRPWVAHSGWPLTYEDLAPYYTRAARFLGVDDQTDDAAAVTRAGIEPPAFDPSLITYHVSRWCSVPDLWRRYRDRIRRSRNVTLFLHANVTDLGLDASGKRLSHVSARSLQGAQITVRARQVVICCGGLESARLLLANNRQHAGGLGNAHGLVGRYLQDHAGAVLADLEPVDGANVQHLFNLFHWRGVKYSVRCSAAPALQEREQILTASASIMFLAGEDSSFAALKAGFRMLRSRTMTPELSRIALRVAAHPVSLARPIVSYVFRRRTFTPEARLRLAITTEQEPNPDSRVFLGTEVDRLGMPKLVIDWRLTDLTWVTTRKFLETLSRQFELAGIGSFRFDEWLQDEEAWRTRLVDHYHHIGTTRMHASPTSGVVDAHCRVHGIENLFIGSSSVFPTSGHSNPTLTIIALSIRIADTIRARLRA